MAHALVAEKHPLDDLIRRDRMPHIWCPGCGIGIVMRCYAQAILESGIPVERHVVVSGIGCTARVPGYMNLDSYHATHGRPVPFAIGLKLAKPELMVTVFSGDGDLAAIGGNHLIHAARRNVDIKIICINNFNYGMTGGQVGPTTPLGAKTTTTPYGNPEHPFNLPYLMAAAGAVFVSRWTALHVRQIKEDILYSFRKPGFTFVEVLAPCPVGFGRPNDIEDGVEEMRIYRRRSRLVYRVPDEMPWEALEVDLREERPIYVGRFVDREREVFQPVRLRS
ncbi:thiamine pyrophosphate-dependent enzyme [Thermoflexus sp.]|uniref:thiamine pyrophosphate-dependent enzyme n=1 Tax=Thermoflexus sp. TaxID=1969742 RepID=UPI0025EFC6A8|nr:thiamine pyrophosphate-dependent enzyme [Thermoflexus sp.]MDW8180529.1 thiamine pyrophosphate-dependent enzyme [Anaerolineae bacterium]MCS6962483.1 thiamine pyrophosphate-dependent enzyme [Thermoflexus sp.]MCS7351076.1 thiamine pyrophosphate-dependent enzyme [Thermoflexus sp.]MCX7690396.1 thiamine pyrophosphate-dependent enzyme [Thermoflexus sp.]MDW8183651.1 thiamine pyrophosphate-dependent enzyme [Anaerolineae bacterium]